MKITKRTREQAALICAISASNWDPNMWQAALAAGVDPSDTTSFSLAVDACCFVVDSLGNPHGTPNPETRAEAEALLRTGWTP